MRRVVSRARALVRAAPLTAALAVPLASAAPLALSGCALFGDEKRDESAELLDRMREAQAERRSASRGEPEAPKAEDLLREGDRLRRSGDLPRAVWAYLRAQAMAPEDPRPRARIGAVRLQVDPKRAEETFRELVASTEGSAAARTGLGLALIARQAWGEAAAELREAVARDETLAVAHDALGVALERAGDVEGARACYRRAAALQPRSHEALNNLGVSYLRTGEFAAAAEALEAAARIEPRDPAVANNLGLALGRLRRYGLALEAFRDATDSEQAALNNLGYVHYLNGDYAGALEVYERALLADGRPEQRLAVLRNLRRARRALDGEAPLVQDPAEAFPPVSGDPIGVPVP